MKVLAFAGSTSRQSINKQFVSYFSERIDSEERELIDLNDFSMPIFSIDEEKENGIPTAAKVLYEKLQASELIVISLAEHNGSYTAAFKNIFDWVSRHELNMFAEKKLILLSTAPGARGGAGVMDAALDRFPRHGAEILGHFSLPKFHSNFDSTNGVIDPELKEAFVSFLSTMNTKLQ